LSRSRYWGTPLPIWVTEDRKEIKCIGSLEELSKEIEKANNLLTTHNIQLTTLKDLHRPYVDNVILVSDSGKPMKRETDLIDVWFDSGAMPYAQWHYPFENKEKIDGPSPSGGGTFEQNSNQGEATSPSGGAISDKGSDQGVAYPADFISEGVDQTRGWFFTLHAISGMLFDKVAFKNVISTGLVLDKSGEKMSKRKGNVINPFETLSAYGPDATRWYMVSNANPWDNLKFDLEGVTEVQRKLFGTLYNTYNFYAIYANLDGFKIDEMNIVPIEKRPEFDRWIISELQVLIKTVTESYENYDVTKAARAIEEFVDANLSNWYIRLSRKRFWKGEFNEDKKAAYETLHECLLVCAQLMSPISPFFSEWIYKNLTDSIRQDAISNKTTLAPISVHLINLTKANEDLIDNTLSESMKLAQKACSLIHSVRKLNNLRVRLPLAKVYVNASDANLLTLLDKASQLIKEETNIKEVITFDPKSGMTLFTKSVLPDLKKLGKALGSKINEVKGKLIDLSQDDIAILESSGLPLTFSDGTVYNIQKDDVIIKTSDAVGMASATDGNLTVAVDTLLTEDLRKEGIARDLVNRVQNLRKEMGLEVQDKIRIEVQKLDELVNSALESNKEYICTETQALEFYLKDNVLNASLVDMDEFNLELKVEKI
ncbi:MAG: class I tRNA ligase family protein, partial [Opitutaceae bacterium]|nr:class I tRNA ligase family protein [Cytophagales bacterium]